MGCRAPSSVTLPPSAPSSYPRIILLSLPQSPSVLEADGTQCRVVRAGCLACAAYMASVPDNAFGRLGDEEREAGFGREKSAGTTVGSEAWRCVTWRGAEASATWAAGRACAGAHVLRAGAVGETDLRACSSRTWPAPAGGAATSGAPRVS
ncbi:hypothetical protein FB451DRAFT_1568050 [Mycena latifolia]|nr:hypothetical protein FB451DRAFT_1568050 [Mycena latifolia]